MLQLAAQVRHLLSERFGPSMRARTTEELCADPQVRDWLGEEQFQSLTRLLYRADRGKFAPLSPADADIDPVRELPSWRALAEMMARPPSPRAVSAPSPRENS
jgi:hypothetical protein